MEFVRTLKDLSKNDVLRAGGKGASLGEMVQAGIPVPGGFVVLTDAFNYFLEKNALTTQVASVLASVDSTDSTAVETASITIRTLLESQSMPHEIAAAIHTEFDSLQSTFVAVRSSATAEDGAAHAWAGQLDSFLNVSKEDVYIQVIRCWSSLFTPRAIFYRHEKGLSTTLVSVAVVIQKMVNAEKSGIAFSVHPVTENKNHIIIEAGLGLGEAIVSGSITPDSYVVEKDTGTVVNTTVNTQKRALYRGANGGNEWITLSPAIASAQVLTANEISELSELVKKIETHYGCPQDIEWAYESGKFYIVQSRPITTLG